MKFLIPSLTSFLITAILLPVVITLATACNCLDTPGGRRLHARSTPRLGGLAVFAGVLPFLMAENNGMEAVVVASALLVLLGVSDDVRSLGWRAKLAGMAVVATIAIFGGGIVIHTIGSYPYFGTLDLGWFSIPFTYLSIIGITNAINLLDGLDGLAGGVSLLGFMFMGIAALQAGDVTLAVTCFAFAGAMAAFLLYNFPKAKVFMGDSGSLLLGFSFSIIAVKLTQGEASSVATLFPVLVLLLPIFDTLRVLFERVANGVNPFKADHLHLHYLLLHANVSPVLVTLLFWGATAVFGFIALFCIHSSSMMYLAFVINASLLLGLVTFRISRRHTGSATQLSNTYPFDCSGPVLDGAMRIEAFKYRFARKKYVMRQSLVVALSVVLFPAQLFAASDCWYREFPDHYLAVCIGDEKRVSGQDGAIGISDPASGGNESGTDKKVAAANETTGKEALAASRITTSSGKTASLAAESSTPARQISVQSVTQSNPTAGAYVIPSMYRAPRSILTQKKSTISNSQPVSQEGNNGR